MNYKSEKHAYRSMKDRCLKADHQWYKYYGGRGITICDRWLISFENFFEDMGAKPTPKHSLDRYPNQNGNYEPSNCRWATQKEQCRNRRSNVYLTAHNETKLITDWCKDLNIHYLKLQNLLNTDPFERVYDNIKNGIFPKRKKIYITIDGESKSLPEWFIFFDIAPMTYYRRIGRGFSVYDALTKKKETHFKIKNRLHNKQKH